jgi:hypothetical protein
MKVLFAYLLAVGLLTCTDEKTTIVCPPECSQEATVVDYTGTDGCGLMFELNDGTKLVPARYTYVTAPSREDDPLYHYDLKAGEKVFIGYRLEKAVDGCMMGQIVFITCIYSPTQE